MAGEEPKKENYHLSHVVKKILERKSSQAHHKTHHKTVGRSLWPSSSAQDLRFFEMEKERDDATSPRGVLEAHVRNLEDSNSNSCDAENPRHEGVSQPRSRWLKFFKLWKKGFSKRPPVAPKSYTKKDLSSRHNARNADVDLDVDLSHFKSSWQIFTLKELKVATNNFSEDNVIGRGGFADVYKGCLDDGRLVAVKRLNKGTTEEQIIGFLSEIGTIAHVDHPNTATLIGYGIEGGTHLVMELSPHGNLGSLLRGAKEKLDWGARYKIIHGTANGLLYLHENCQKRIIHRDIKADNILLMENFEPQVSICKKILLESTIPSHLCAIVKKPKQSTYDLSVVLNASIFVSILKLDKWLTKRETKQMDRRYFAPEYFMHGIVDEKIDVFSYGVLVLELITGRQALHESQKSLVLWAKPLIEGNAIRELVDPSLGDDYDQQQLERVILAASLCIELSPVLRPRMSQVVMLLRNDYNPKGSNPQQKKRAFQRTYSEELLDAQEYNQTKHLTTRLIPEHKSQFNRFTR